jgi:hypothetical protein
VTPCIVVDDDDDFWCETFCCAASPALYGSVAAVFVD